MFFNDVFIWLWAGWLSEWVSWYWALWCRELADLLAQELFEKHHYLKGGLPTMWGLMVRDEQQLPVGFHAVAWQTGCSAPREARVVVLPECQGARESFRIHFDCSQNNQTSKNSRLPNTQCSSLPIVALCGPGLGLGTRLSDTVASRCGASGFQLMARTKHPRLGGCASECRHSSPAIARFQGSACCGQATGMPEQTFGSQPQAMRRSSTEAFRAATGSKRATKMMQR